MLPPDLLEVLVCPTSKQPLLYFPPDAEAGTADAHGFLLCAASRLRYAILDGVPIMLAEEATEVSADQLAGLIARARQLGLRNLPA